MIKEANKCVGIHGAIFDVDGTLLDSMVIWEEAAVRYLNSLGLEPEENISEKNHDYVDGRGCRLFN